MQVTKQDVRDELGSRDQGTAENVVFRWLGNYKVKMLHSDPKTIQEASVSNMSIEKLNEHAQNFISARSGCRRGSRIPPAIRR